MFLIKKEVNYLDTLFLLNLNCQINYILFDKSKIYIDN